MKIWDSVYRCFILHIFVAMHYVVAKCHNQLFIDLQVLYLSGTYYHKTSTGPPSCTTPRETTIYGRRLIFRWKETPADLGYSSALKRPKIALSAAHFKTTELTPPWNLPRKFYLFSITFSIKRISWKQFGFQAGSFGGTYFRPIYSSVTKKKYGPEVWQELPKDWIEGLNVKIQVIQVWNCKV